MKTLALYLPQFHTIPENDEWWGKGFTEWVNMKKAKPLFEGHYQPRIPLNNNYYDLSDVNVMRWQTKIAKEYGIYGFCVYHYWFHGHKLLEKPMEQYLNEKDIDFPFCFCWANEHWTNAWVSSENKILIEQDFKDRDDWKAHFEYFLPFFKDDRYIKENNKPFLVIYLPSIIEPLDEMLEYWNQLAIENGFDGMEFAYQHYMYYLDESKDKSSFDYGIEFEPNLSMNEIKPKSKATLELLKIKLSVFLQTKLHIYLKLRKKNAEQIDYDAVWDNVLRREPKNDKMIPGAFVDWDNTPRKKEKGSLMVGASPEKFEVYFDKLIQKAQKKYKTDKIILFAWNEWAEGGYLEPDEKYGYGYLEAIRNVLKKNNEFPW
ncbi:MAG: glycoside hydrolase family 99-like domain-containing protein [Eubacterium sp.]|nr:glycoside hydrolase family 99-like domain-containing protein [Eubacterium sp.]